MTREQIMEITGTNKCSHCKEEFCNAKPHWEHGFHKKCHFLNWRDNPKSYSKRKYGEICLHCQNPFSEKDPHFSKGQHSACYLRNRARVRGEVKGKYKTKNSKCVTVGYEMRTYDRSKREKLLNKEDQMRTIPMLQEFYETVKKKSGYVDIVGVYTIVHLYETFYPYDTEFLGVKPIEEQIKIMWQYLKTIQDFKI